MNKMTLKDVQPIRLHGAYLKEVRNSELFVCYKQLTVLLSEREFETNFIKQHVDRLLEYDEALVALHEQPLRHRYTIEINQTADALRRLLMSIRNVVRSLDRAADGSEDADGRLLLGWIRKSQQDMVSRGQQRLLSAVRLLVASYRSDEEVSAAVERAGIGVLMDQVEVLFPQFAQMIEVRIRERGRLKEVRDGFKRQILADMTLLFRRLTRLSVQQTPERDKYRRLCIDIAQLLSDTRSLYKTRLTRLAQKRAEQEAADANGVDGANGAMEAEGMAEAMTASLNGGTADGAVDAWFDALEEELNEEQNGTLGGHLNGEQGASDSNGAAATAYWAYDENEDQYLFDKL